MNGDQQLWRRTDDFVSTEMEDGLIVMLIDHGKYFSISPTGSAIWSLLEPARTVEGIAAELTREFRVSASDAKAETARFLAELRTRNLAFPVPA